jgi:hypothetical protein
VNRAKTKKVIRKYSSEEPSENETLFDKEDFKQIVNDLLEYLKPYSRLIIVPSPNDLYSGHIYNSFFKSQESNLQLLSKRIIKELTLNPTISTIMKMCSDYEIMFSLLCTAINTVISDRIIGNECIVHLIIVLVANSPG